MSSLPKDDLQPFKDGQLSLEVFELIRKEYRERFGHTIVYSDLEGNLLYGLPNCDKFPCEESCRLARRQAIEMGMNYGSPLPTRCPKTYLFWSLPVSLNNTILGGLVVVGVAHLQQWDSTNSPGKMERAQYGLTEIAERYNIVNTALLQQRRRLLRRNSQVFRNAFTPKIPSLQELWHSQSKPFFQAIQENDRQAVFNHLAQVLHVLSQADARALPEAKGFALELFASAVEASIKGRQDKELYFQFHYETAEKIVLCRNLEEVCHTTEERLDHFINIAEQQRTKAKSQTVQKALTFIEENLQHSSLKRALVAKRVGISPSRLSHLMKEETGESFSDILRRFRMEQARKVLVSSDNSISMIALQSGYCDQSHFTKVFQKYFGMSPMRYRQEHRLQ